MKTQKVKTPRRSGALYSSGSKQTKASTSFSDNRSETITQRKLSEMAGQSFNHSDSVQLKQVLNSKAIPVQKIQDEEEELLQGKFATAQRQKAEEEELLQGKFSNIQRKENNTGLPDSLKSGVENLSGMSMDDVKVHRNSGEPAKVQAHAFAQGTNIYLAPGQEKHLPHEAWHVVQQKQGRVKPTIQLKGKVNVNDDAGLEREADVMGGKANSAPLTVNSRTEKNDAGAFDVVQRVGPLDYLTGNMSEDEKDQSYFRRSSYNPMNWMAQRSNVSFEQNNTAYHSTSVHGAQNTLNNIRDRHYPNPGGPGGMSLMTNTLTGAVGTIRRQQHSSRFASSSWEKHARNDAMVSFANAAGGLNVNWNAAPPPFGAPGVGQSTSMFYISYSNPTMGDYEVGVTSHKPGGAGAAGPPNPALATNTVKVTINYFQTSPNQITAWIGQIFPVPNALPANNTGPVIAANFQGTAWSLSDFNPFG